MCAFPGVPPHFIAWEAKFESLFEKINDAVFDLIFLVVRGLVSRWIRFFDRDLDVSIR